jgi:Rrf2 family protein
MHASVPTLGKRMNISVKSEYALKAVFDLASQYLAATRGSAATPVKIADIAKRQKIPQKFLELILAGLKQNGFVDSRRGAEGGYLLARTPDAITVGEVLRAVENLKSSSRQASEDPFADIWQRVDSAVSDVLDRTSFAELARDWQQRHTEYVPNWEI